MRRALAVVAAAMLLVSAACGNGDDTPRITLGSADFGESVLLAEIYAQALEAEGYDVGRRLRIGSREVYFPALESGEVDLVPEYTGSLVRFVTKDDASATGDEQETYDNLTDALAGTDVQALDYSAAQDKDGVVVNAETAQAHDLESFSDLEAVAGDLIMGAPPECTEPQRLCGQLAANGIDFQEVRPMDGATAVQLLNANEIQAANLFSTDARIAENEFVSLADDLEIVPAENVVPVVRNEIVNAYGDDLVELLEAVTARLTTEVLTELNRRVDVEVEDPEDVAADWLSQEGFLSS